ncbi:glycosyltransferase family 2 protein [Kribbella sp. NPDC020789]
MAVLPAHVRRHWLLAVFLLAGTALRVLATIGYQPGIIYVDSQQYLFNMELLKPDQLNPIGYSIALKPLVDLGGISLVVIVQHVAGLLLGIAIYALARRLTVYRWLSALAAAPLLLDAYQVQIEQNVMAETLFDVLLVGILWLLLAKVNWMTVAAAGVLVGAAFSVRTIGLVLLLAVVVYVGWRRALVAVAGFAVVAGAYVGYFHSETGRWGFSGADGLVLYGRAAVVADCSRYSAGPLCPGRPRQGVDYYAHTPLPAGTTREQATAFAHEVIKQQPLDITWAALKDFAKGFAPTRTTAPDDVPLSRWQFQLTYPNLQDINTAAFAEKYGGRQPHVVHTPAAILRAYQLHGGYTSGTLLGLCALLGLIGAVRMRAALLPALAGLLLLLGSAAFEFSWRYQLPALVFFPLAGAIGLRAILGKDQARPPLAAYPDAVDAQATKGFEPRFAPIVVVIAAYNEAGGIGSVLAKMPRTCAGLPVDVLVVVDGATDDTAAIARQAGATVVVAESNRGQGAALRLGYHVAARGGAQYVVTTDADGQYDNDELGVLLQPILDDRADFVTGSRRLGAEDADSRLRWLGVRVFAVLASVLTRQRLTDTSFGFRAMRAELATAVTLREPQYQSSELLLGALALGARVVELPMTMRRRGDGTSKKGPGLVYGANYARVMTTTWLREYVVRPKSRRRAAWRTPSGRTA